MQYNDDVRLGELIIHEEGKQSDFQGDVVLLGFPYDMGVERNNGRIGARQGPSSLRKLNKRIGTVVNLEYQTDLRNVKVSDCGDIDSTLSLESAHKELTSRVFTILKEGKIPFIVGGGNDQSYPNASALLGVSSEGHLKGHVGVVNIDAHLDTVVTEFFAYSFPERFDAKYFAEFAAQGSQCSAVHANYITDKGGKIYWLKHLRESGNVVESFKKVLDSLGENIFVSFDIDSIIGADCPGVSAPGVVGLTSQEALEMCFVAGKHPKVRLFDLSEYNPVIEEYRTGKLVGNMFYFFCMGVSKRNSLN